MHNRILNACITLSLLVGFSVGSAVIAPYPAHAQTDGGTDVGATDFGTDVGPDVVPFGGPVPGGASVLPTIGLIPQDVIVCVPEGGTTATVNLGMATSSGGVAPVSVTGTRSDGQPLTAPFPVGTTTVTWVATDARGTASTPRTSQVTVIRVEITCPPNVTRTLALGETEATVTAAELGTVTAVSNYPQPGTVVTPLARRSDGRALTDAFPIGTTTITYTGTDPFGCTATCTQLVTVVAPPPPPPVPTPLPPPPPVPTPLPPPPVVERVRLTCPADVTLCAPQGPQGATITAAQLGTATAIGGSGELAVTGTRSDGRALTDRYPPGRTTITWTASDATGQREVCQQSVFVIKITIVCPEDKYVGINRPARSGRISAAELGRPRATSNYPQAGTPVAVVGRRSDGRPLTDPYPVDRITTITWTATDDFGCSASCPQRIDVFYSPKEARPTRTRVRRRVRRVTRPRVVRTRRVVRPRVRRTRTVTPRPRPTYYK